ncbi:MAG: 50S ribosomal protein L3 [bacterium]
MMRFILAKKIGSSQVFNEEGKIVPVTLVQAGPCVVLTIKTKKSDGYDAVQVGFGKQKERKVKKTMKGKEYRHVAEFRVKGNDVIDKEMKPGDIINASTFVIGEKIKISGVSKGKGFQGVVKRWSHHGRNASHGTKHEERTIGSVGTSFPQRVIKGKKMPGRMGTDRVTIKSAKVEKIDLGMGIISIKGAIPGINGGLLELVAR